MEWGLSPFDGSYSTGVVYCAMSFLLRELQYVMFVLTNKTFVYLEKHGLCTVCPCFLFFMFLLCESIGPTDPLSSPSHKIPVAPKSTTVTLTSRANSAQAAGSILVQIESPARLASFGRTHAKTTLPASTPTYLFRVCIHSSPTVGYPTFVGFRVFFQIQPFLGLCQPRSPTLPSVRSSVGRTVGLRPVWRSRSAG